MFGTEQAAMQDLNNPFSPYYIGKPTVPEQIRSYLNGGCRVNTAGYYNTNYLGAAKATYLAQPKCDYVEIRSKIRDRNKFNNIAKIIALGATSLVGFLLLRKIPGIGKLTTGTISTTANGIWSGVKGIFKGIGWMFKK